MLYIIKRVIRRSINSWLKPRVFLLEYEINYDIIGPIFIIIFYLGLNFLKLTLAEILNKGSISFFPIILISLTYFIEIILTSIILLILLNLLRIKINYLKDFLLIIYSFSIKNVLLIINILIFLNIIVFQLINIYIIIDYVLTQTGVFYSIMLQAYYFYLKFTNIRFIQFFIFAFLTWINVYLLRYIFIYFIIGSL
jgi:hypothetical protein